MTAGMIAEVTNHIHDLYCKYPGLSGYIMDMRRLTEATSIHHHSTQCSENTILVAIRYLIDAKKARQIPRGRSRERVSAAFVFVSLKQHLPEQYWEEAKSILKERTNSSGSNSFENTISDVECFLRDKEQASKFKINSSFRYSKDELKLLRTLHQSEKSILVL